MLTLRSSARPVERTASDARGLLGFLARAAPRRARRGYSERPNPGSRRRLGDDTAPHHRSRDAPPSAPPLPMTQPAPPGRVDTPPPTGPVTPPPPPTSHSAVAPDPHFRLATICTADDDASRPHRTGQAAHERIPPSNPTPPTSLHESRRSNAFHAKPAHMRAPRGNALAAACALRFAQLRKPAACALPATVFAARAAVVSARPRSSLRAPIVSARTASSRRGRGRRTVFATFISAPCGSLPLPFGTARARGG